MQWPSLQILAIEIKVLVTFDSSLKMQRYVLMQKVRLIISVNRDASSRR